MYYYIIKHIFKELNTYTKAKQKSGERTVFIFIYIYFIFWNTAYYQVFLRTPVSQVQRKKAYSDNQRYIYIKT